jgi:hypothetical protein
MYIATPRMMDSIALPYGETSAPAAQWYRQSRSQNSLHQTAIERLIGFQMPVCSGPFDTLVAIDSRSFAQHNEAGPLDLYADR